MAFDILTDIELVAAYFLPILFLMAFVGRAGKKYIIYLFWGFLASVPVLILTPAIIHAIPIANPELTVSPLLEEFFKALPIIIPALIGAKNRDDDLLVCAMASGIGFSLIENIIHVNSDLVGYQLQTIGTSLAGFFSTPHAQAEIFAVLATSFSATLMHGCTGGIIGYGVVLIRNFDRAALPTLLFGFYTIAVMVHALYNLLLLPAFHRVGPMIDLIFPVFLFFLLHALYHVDVPVLFRKNPET